MKHHAPRLAALTLATLAALAHAQSDPRYEFRAAKKGLTVSSTSGGSGAGGGTAPSPLTRQVSASTSAVDFNQVAVGGSEKAQVLLSNTGTGAVTLSGVTVSGSEAYSVSTLCGATLAAGASCLSEVTFAPLARGAAAGLLSIASDATAGGVQVSLAGTGVQAEGSLAADTTADFGAVSQGATATRSFTFTNTGNTTATGVYASMTGSDVTFAANTCGTAGSTTSLAAGSSCSVTVSYAPASVETLSGASLALLSSAVNSPSTLALSGSGVAANVQASGGTVLTPGDGYRYHYFTTTGAATLTVTSNLSGRTAEVLVVGGGGGGGRFVGGGGGGGGVVYSAAYALTSGAAIPVTVGLGGSGSNAVTVRGSNGQNSVFGTLTAIGGGGGGSGSNAVSTGSSGGSGGGGSFRTGYTSAGTGTAGQGESGGSGRDGTTYSAGGGGGGAGGVGESVTVAMADTRAGNGGVGKAFSITGTSVYYGGGGGGGVDRRTPGVGGLGGGGNGSITSGSAGTANTGGGGGGGGWNGSSEGNGGAGGSGVVIVRYPYQ